MSVLYIYDLTDFTSLDPLVPDPVNVLLLQEIINAGLGTPEDLLVYVDDDVTHITFTAAVDVPTLSGVIAAHTGLDGEGEPPPAPGEPALTPANFIEINIVPTAGQVTFLLTKLPAKGSTIEFIVNGQEQTQGLFGGDEKDFVINGLTITWKNRHFSLETTDEVTIRYISE